MSIHGCVARTAVTSIFWPFLANAVTYARYYNRRYNRRGYFWGDRFKSVIVDRGETLVNCLAYIDLNPLHAGMVKQPEKYRWNSIGYHMQTDTKDHFLSTDFGLKEFHVRGESQRIRRYRRYMYEAGSIDRPDKGRAKVIDPCLLAKQKNKDFEITKASRLRYRRRYFTDSGIIGSKEFVSTHYQRFQHLFTTKHKYNKSLSPYSYLPDIALPKHFNKLFGWNDFNPIIGDPLSPFATNDQSAFDTVMVLFNTAQSL